MKTGLLARIDLIALVAGGLMCVLWAAFAEPAGAASVALGAGLAVLNFAALRMIVGRMIDPKTGETNPAAGGLLVGKFALVAVLLFVVFSVVGADVLAFGLGVTAVPLAMIVETLYFLPRRRAAESST